MRPDRSKVAALVLIIVSAACTATPTTTVSPPPTSTTAAAAPTSTVAATTTVAPSTTTSVVAAGDCAGRYSGGYEGARSGPATGALLPAGMLRLSFEAPREAGRLSVGQDGEIAGSVGRLEIIATLDPEECVIRGQWSEGADVGSFELSRQEERIGRFQDLELVELEEVDSPDIEVRSDGGLVAYALPASVLFAIDSAEVRPGGEATVDVVGTSIRRRFTPDATIVVRGHTDSVGDADYNLDLSQRRADAVAALLAARLENFEIVAEGLGETEPRADNSTRLGRGLNRRVEIFVDPGE